MAIAALRLGREATKQCSLVKMRKKARNAASRRTKNKNVRNREKPLKTGNKDFHHSNGAAHTEDERSGF